MDRNNPAPPLGGLMIPARSTYRITAVVGDTEAAVPQLLVEAYQKLQAYSFELGAVPSGASTFGYKISSDGLDENTVRNPAWMAKAKKWRFG